MGTFYSHDEVVTRFMGFTNTTLVQFTTPVDPQVTESSDVIGSTATVKTSVEEYHDATTRSSVSETNSAVKNNWVTTLSGLFMVLYAIASVAPFFVYCAASRKFRLEASRFFCSCLSFQCQDYCKHRREKKRDITRTRTNRHNMLNPSVGHSNSFRFTGNLGQTAPVKLIQVQKRRDKPGDGQAARNVSWGKADHYGTARL